MTRNNTPETAPKPNIAILDTVPYGADRPWADGVILMLGKAIPSAFFSLAPTCLSQGPLRTKCQFFSLRSKTHFGKTMAIFFSAWLAVTPTIFGHSAGYLMLFATISLLPTETGFFHRISQKKGRAFNPRWYQIKSRRPPHDLF